jgi:hypothetical protein
MAGPAGLQNTSMYFALRAAYAFKMAPGHLVKPFGSTPALGPAQFLTLWLQVLKMAGPAGFEPTHARIKTWCLTAWRRPIKSVIT